MTDNWFIQDVERLLAHRQRVVIIDPDEKCEFLVSLLDDTEITVFKTDGNLTEKWEQVKEELYLRCEAETKYKDKPVVFYATRQENDLSFLFDYCFTHGSIDLTHFIDWLKKKLFEQTKLQVTFDDSELLNAAKLSIGKDLAWWKKILQNLEDMVNLEDELLPFLHNPKKYLGFLDSDIRRLFEAKVFELLGQSYMKKPPQTLADEVVKNLCNGLAEDNVQAESIKLYKRWADSETYRPSLKNYLQQYQLPKDTDPWQAHPDHCFEELDIRALREITEKIRDEQFVAEKLEKIKARNESSVHSFVPVWWNDVITILEFDSQTLSSCNSFEAVVDYYTGNFAPVDRAIRNLYMHFLSDENILRPLQEYYESLNHELLETWFEHAADYQQNQQGYLVNLLNEAQPKMAVIVGDGISYEIANYVASQMESQFNVEKKVMLADMPSETEHNMSAMYVGNNEVLAKKADRERRLSEITGKEIKYLDLEELNYGEDADYLVLSYKDIDDTGEKLQHGAIKLFAEFEKVLKEKITLLLMMGYREVHLVTDHGFVLTGILDESDKIDPNAKGIKKVAERYIRTVEKQTDRNWLEFEKPYGEFKYVYAARSHRPFKSRGVYGFAHGGFAPQEIIIPQFTFSKAASVSSGLKVVIGNNQELGAVTGEIFAVKLTAESVASDLFSTQRKIQILLYAGGAKYQSSSIITIKLGETQSFDFSFERHTEIEAVLIDAETKEQLDKASIKKDNLRDLGGLL